ncbi:MAG: transporter substrate-binding domain-containing protein [Eubacteriales bacterium]|nr:transporter substrate-binding domain-containing protein [Eubacteriales bacterium]
MKNKFLNKVTKTFSAAVLIGALAAMTGCGSTAASSDADAAAVSTANSAAAASTADASAASSAAGSSAAAEDTAAAADTADVQQIKVGISTYPSPNYRINDEGEEEGYELEVLKAIDDLLPQYEIEIVPLEFSSLFVALNSDQVQVLSANLRRSESRDEEYIHTYRAYNHSPYRIFVEDSNTDINSMADLDGKRVGVAQGSLMEIILKDFIETTGAEIEFVYSNDAASDLAAGRIDAFINPDFTLDDYNSNFTDIQFKLVGEVVAGSEGPTADSNAYFYLTAGHEQIRDDFSEAIQELKDNGTLGELNAKFFGRDTTGEIEVDKEEEQIAALGK